MNILTNFLFYNVWRGGAVRWWASFDERTSHVTSTKFCRRRIEIIFSIL